VAWAAWTCDVRRLSNAQCTSEKGRSDAALFLSAGWLLPLRTRVTHPAHRVGEVTIFGSHLLANRHFLSHERVNCR